MLPLPVRTGSLKLNVRLAFTATRVALSAGDRLVSVGGVVSAGTVLVVIVTALLVSAPSVLKFPNASENLFEAIEITLLAVLLAAGV